MRRRTSSASLLLVLLFSVGFHQRAGEPAVEEWEATVVLVGRVFQSGTGSVIEDGIVVIAGERVVCSGERLRCRVPAGALLHRVEEGTILPGLIDLHVHARPHYVGAFLPAGVTTIRDASNSLAVVDSLRSAPGAPTVVASGPLLDGPTSTMREISPTAGALGEHPLRLLNPVLVEDSATAARAVHALADSNVDFVKLYQRLSLPAFRGAVAAARTRSLPVAADLGLVSTGGLTGSEVDLVDASRAGVRTVEHLSGLALAYERRGGDPLTPPYDLEILDAIARDLLEAGVAAVPTLATLIQSAEPSALSWQDVPGARLAAYFQEWWQGLIARADVRGQVVAADRQLVTSLLRRLHEGGLLIGAGSDLPAAPMMVPGGALHMELEALVEAGLSPTEALQAATWNAAMIVGRRYIGHLDPGARADILVVEGDPTVDIRATRAVRQVWFGGAEVDLEAAWTATETALEAVMAPGSK